MWQGVVFAPFRGIWWHLVAFRGVRGVSEAFISCSFVAFGSFHGNLCTWVSFGGIWWHCHISWVRIHFVALGDPFSTHRD